VELLPIVLRTIHIGAGVLWVGGSALFFFFLEPTMNKLGPDAERFIDEVMNKRKAPIYFLVSSTLTVIGGAILYWRDSSGLNIDWITSPGGLAFTVGGIAAILGWLGGNLLIPTTVMKLSAVGGQMKAAGGPPSPDLLSRLHALQERLHTIGLVDLVLLGIAVLGMASARYL
jgi:hypothetical protein